MTPGNLFSRTKNRLQRYGISSIKRLGQHFLVDEGVLELILKEAQLSQNDEVLEIGPGLGTLTEGLAKRVKHVYAIEKDSRLFDELKTEFITNEQVTLLLGDAVRIKWPKTTKLVANLPYNISSPILFRFLESNISFALLMLQDEFAQRLAAHPGSKTYGRLSVMINHTIGVELITRIQPESFYPPPKVSSALVRLMRLSNPRFQVLNPSLFGKLVTALFGQRRKKIKTPLKTFLTQLSLQTSQINSILEDTPWIHQRVEELAPEELANLANLIHEALK